MVAVAPEAIHPEFREDIRRAWRILTDGGCSDVFLFGSVPEGDAGPTSDIDIAVRGCPARSLFGLFGKLLMELKHSVDLVDLDECSDFADRLVTEERLFRVAGKV